MTKHATPEICDYEGSAYRTEFWGQGRDYEDAAERAALRHLLPPSGHRLIDIGGGYGRLVPLYNGYDQVVIFDYALSQLRQARQLWGTMGEDGHPRYLYVAGDFYRLPFAPAVFDTVVMIRTLHHAADAPAVLRGVSQILSGGGTFVLEFANKRNLKAIIRYLVGRQDWSPFAPEPVEFVPLNFDFHPSWIRETLSNAGLRVRRRRAVSTFRLALLKQLVPTRLLVTLDRLCQPAGGLLPLSPSVFLRCRPAPERPEDQPAHALFRCTQCGSTDLLELPDHLSCPDCGASFSVTDNLYNFKVPNRQSDPPAPTAAPSPQD